MVERTLIKKITIKKVYGSEDVTKHEIIFDYEDGKYTFEHLNTSGSIFGLIGKEIRDRGYKTNKSTEIDLIGDMANKEGCKHALEGVISQHYDA